MSEHEFIPPNKMVPGELKDIDRFITEHTRINYCEAIIHKDGMIEYAMPSHVECLLRITGEDRDVINKKMPLSASPIIWLTEYTGCIAIWVDGFIWPKEVADVQLVSLRKLFKAGLTEYRNMGGGR